MLTVNASRSPEADQPWLTVVIPTHNGERWLARTLASLAAQTQMGFDCLLIDSSASDATAKIAATFQDRLQLQIERRQDLPTWMEKTNLGVEQSKTAYVCMLHQDDIWEPQRAAAVKSWLAASSNVVMHLHPSWIIDDCDRRLGIWQCPLPPDTSIPGKLLRERLIVQNFVAICAPVIRRDAFLAVGGLDLALWYTADWDLYLKLVQIGSFAYHRERLSGFRIHAMTQTVTGSRKAEAFLKQLRTVLERHQTGIDPTILARAHASVRINVALAAALHRRSGSLVHAILDVVALGPRGAYAFFRDTRLVERLLPRLRLYLAGHMTARP